MQCTGYDKEKLTTVVASIWPRGGWDGGGGGDGGPPVHCSCLECKKHYLRPAYIHLPYLHKYVFVFFWCICFCVCFDCALQECSSSCTGVWNAKKRCFCNCIFVFCICLYFDFALQQQHSVWNVKKRCLQSRGVFVFVFCILYFVFAYILSVHTVHCTAAAAQVFGMFTISRQNQNFYIVEKS